MPVWESKTKVSKNCHLTLSLRKSKLSLSISQCLSLPNSPFPLSTLCYSVRPSEHSVYPRQPTRIQSFNHIILDFCTLYHIWHHGNKSYIFLKILFSKIVYFPQPKLRPSFAALQQHWRNTHSMDPNFIVTGQQFGG